MKNISIYIALFIGFTACKQAPKKNIDNQPLTTVSGEFLYYQDAAVINTGRKVYGVFINEKMHELDSMVKAYKKLEHDMIPVKVKGIIHHKKEGEQGWPEIIDIKEIIAVADPTDANPKDIIISTN